MENFEGTDSPQYETAPDFPPDMFAIAALLLQKAGAYQHVVSAEKAPLAHFPEQSILITESDRNTIVKNGEAWSKGETPKRVLKLWNSLIKERGNVYHDGKGTKSPKWWKDAFELMATADEASVGAGFYTQKPSDMTWVAIAANARLQNGTPQTVKSKHIRHFDNRCSITSELVNQDIVCVQPKSRTPDVGCSLRNMSHNLSLLPPRGEMRVHWLTPPASDVTDETTSNLNLLIIPYPYYIENSWIRGTAICNDSSDGWGWFDLEQRWLDLHAGSLTDYIDALIAQCTTDTGWVNGIVFPELALSYELYEKIAKHLRDHHRSVQFLVSGSSSNCNGDKGNFALASHFYNSGSERMMATVSRPKHHRWSLEKSQIDTYDLANCFPPMQSKNVRWWENIPLSKRSIHVNALRSSSVFTAMICEDLARSDPAHGPLRAVGPNLVFVLLMDGPQEEWRWANRYSTGLAEDPGSSVLTITSRALMTRWNRAPHRSQSWNVAIWKDETGRAKTIECKPQAQAVCIQLAGKPEVERTVDGRKGREAYSWIMVNDPKQITLPPEHVDLVQLFCGP